MAVVGIIILFTLFIIGEWIYLRWYQHQDKLIQSIKIQPGEMTSRRPMNGKSAERYYHPGHTWVDFNPDDLTVEIGLDQFTQKIMGKIENAELPGIGQIIHQGNPIWTLIRGNRKLIQISPISGKVIEARLNDIDSTQWVIKLQPIELRQNLNNLIQGALADKWQDWSKSLFIQKFATPLGPVYQDGGELRADLSREISEKEWEKIQSEFFYPSYWLGNFK